MKFLQALVIITASIILCNCSKSDRTPPPQKGTLVFKNTSTNPYQVFVNGKSVIAMQPGQTTQTVSYTVGTCTIRVLQLEGYILYPTDKTFKGELKTGLMLTTTYP